MARFAEHELLKKKIKWLLCEFNSDGEKVSIIFFNVLFKAPEEITEYYFYMQYIHLPVAKAVLQINTPNMIYGSSDFFK